jgi:hypothetical protein
MTGLMLVTMHAITSFAGLLSVKKSPRQPNVVAEEEIEYITID